MTAEIKIFQDDIARVQRGNSEKKINRVFDEVLSLIKGEMSDLNNFFSEDQTKIPEIIKALHAEQSHLMKKFTSKEEITQEIKLYIKNLADELSDSIKNYNPEFLLNRDLSSLNSNNATDIGRVFTNIVFSTQHGKLFFEINILLSKRDYIILSIPIKKGKKIVTNFGESSKQEILLVNDFSKMLVSSRITLDKNIGRSLNENTELFFGIFNKLDIQKLYKMQQVIHSFYSYNNSINEQELKNFIKTNIPLTKIFNNAEDLINEFANKSDSIDLIELNKDLKINLINIKDLNNIIG